MKLKIIKIGGQVINEPDRLNQFLSAFAKMPGPKILVHGGGRKATEISQKLGIKTTLIEGRRVTDGDTLEVAVMVYAGLINKRITALLQKNGNQALGMSGADLNSIRAHKRVNSHIDYGYVGDIDEVNGELIQQILSLNIVPVYCAISHDNQGQLFNTNADTIAARLSESLSHDFSTELYYCFEKEGVLSDPEDDTSVIAHLYLEQYRDHKQKGSISAGMIAKLDNAFWALQNGVGSVTICSAEAIIRQNLEKATQLCL